MKIDILDSKYKSWKEYDENNMSEKNSKKDRKLKLELLKTLTAFDKIRTDVINFAKS